MHRRSDECADGESNEVKPVAGVGADGVAENPEEDHVADEMGQICVQQYMAD